MIQNKNNILERSGKKPIVYDLFYSEEKQPKPIVIFCHGYKGFKDWGAWDLVAETFVKAGFFFLKFNFSHNGGTVNQPIDFPDLEAFAQNNYSKELDDLEDIILHLTTSRKFGFHADISNISLIGHSRGGGIVLIKAEENASIKNVITWAGVCDYRVRFREGSADFNSFKETGRTFVENGRTKQQMPHDWQFYENFIENEERLTIKRAVSALKKPQLIIHGSDDSTVSIDEANALHSWNPNSKLILIKEADHVFSAKHPWNKKSLPKDLETVVKHTCAFIK